jgi:exportin-2 (importin alpha re-exporter)
VYAFNLLDSLVANNQLSTLSSYMTTIWSLLLHRMQEQMKESKTPRYCRLFLHTFLLFAAVYGGMALHDALSPLEKGLVSMVILQIWTPNRLSCAAADPQDIKEMIIGATRILCETAVNQDPVAFGSLLKSVIALLDDSAGAVHDDIECFDEEADSREFDSAYSKLAYAGVTDVNPTQAILSGPVYFATTLSSFSRSRPGTVGPLMRSSLDDKEVTVLQALLTKNGLTIE